MELKDHLLKQGASKSMTELIMLIGRLSCKISDAFVTHQHQATTKNVHGEQQMAMDTFADNLFIKELEKSTLVKAVASEEQENIVAVKKAKGTFGVVMDPLDGSSLIGTNLTVGTILGIYDEGNVLEPGTKMDAALYILYGPLTLLVYTLGKGVHEFFRDADGKFHLMNENLKIPEGNIIAPGALRKDWLPKHTAFIESLEEKGYKLRYSGSLVADFHQILHKGGLYVYPGFKGKEEGKLRLLYEANPLGMIAEQAGGRVSNGSKNLRTIKPQGIGDRTPLYIGEKALIEECEQLA